MKFSELEQIMSTQGANSLADIARFLNTTPQAVSNWKARDQVPYHIESKVNNIDNKDIRVMTQAYQNNQFSEEFESIRLSDILLIIAEQLKVIILTVFIVVFLTFTNVQFIKQPLYESWATVLFPENKATNFSGLAGLASQFGVEVPSGSQADLSSPTLFPDLLRSRVFGEKILDKKFFTNKYNKELTLLALLTHGDEEPSVGRDTLINQALKLLPKILVFNKSNETSFSIIKATSFEPKLARDLAMVALEELEDLNRYYKSQSVGEKISFINQRISSVRNDLKYSEQTLKKFNEQNRQVTSPSLQLELDRLQREVEIQKGIYLTLKQQLELAKIEEVQESSVVRVLDSPQLPLEVSNKNLSKSLIISIMLGSFLGIFIGFLRSYLNNNDMSERKKLRRVRNFVKKKSKDIILDRRVSAVISLLLLLCLPYYLSYESNNPIYFGKYSPKLMILIIFYILSLIISLLIFISLSIKKRNL